MQQQANSGPEHVDERKRKRMISNRESARRSRMKKQHHLEELMDQLTQMQSENSLISQRIEAATPVYLAFESENNVLRAQLMELTDRLRSLNSLLQMVEDVSGFDMDIPEIPEILLEPWQLPCPVQPMPNAF